MVRKLTCYAVTIRFKLAYTAWLSVCEGVLPGNGKFAAREYRHSISTSPRRIAETSPVFETVAIIVLRETHTYVPQCRVRVLVECC
jgi:hypothetical protein